MAVSPTCERYDRNFVSPYVLAGRALSAHAATRRDGLLGAEMPPQIHVSGTPRGPLRWGQHGIGVEVRLRAVGPTLANANLFMRHVPLRAKRLPHAVGWLAESDEALSPCNEGPTQGRAPHYNRGCDGRIIDQRPVETPAGWMRASSANQSVLGVA